MGGVGAVTRRRRLQYIYIRRPLLARGHQAAKDMVAGEVSDVLQVDVLQVSNC